jgi:hypothetical protein
MPKFAANFNPPIGSKPEIVMLKRHNSLPSFPEPAGIERDALPINP